MGVFSHLFFVRVLLGWVAMRIKKERAPARDANPVPTTPKIPIFLKNSPKSSLRLILNKKSDKKPGFSYPNPPMGADFCYNVRS